jgi:hypothetical protein
MPETERDLRDSRTTVLDASGNGSVSFGPDRPNTRWVIRRITVQVSSNTLEPECRVYHGSASPGNVISGTYTGSNNTDDALNETLYPGDRLVVAWTGGDVGATATAPFFGTEISGMA